MLIARKLKSPVLYALGTLLLFMAGFMLIPALYGIDHNDTTWISFIKSILITLACALPIILINYQNRNQLNITLKQTFLLTTLVWLLIAVFGGLPFYFSGHLGFLDSFFEAMSGLTATGSTVMTGLDNTNKSILLWRAMTQSIGGLGIIVIGMSVLPFLNVGGMQLFRTESSDISDKLFAKAKDFALNISVVYLALLVLCTLGLFIAGMNFFDSICHAFTAMSTGGFSTSDGSIGHWNSTSIEWTLVFFMALAAIPFVRLAVLSKWKFKQIFKDTQIQTFLGILLGIWLILTPLHYFYNELPFGEALRNIAFNTTSLITTTGYVSEDYLLWGSFFIVSAFFITMMGGCTGSTSGGIKTFRFQIMWQVFKHQIVSLYNPNRVMPLKYQNKDIDKKLMLSVMNFIAVFMLTCFVSTVLLSFMGVDPITALSGTFTTTANVGPGLGEIIGPAGNFASLPMGAKMVLAFDMLLGRLEFFTVLILFFPDFWRK